MFLKKFNKSMDAWEMESPFLALMTGLLVFSGIFAILTLTLLAVSGYLRKKFEHRENGYANHH